MYPCVVIYGKMNFKYTDNEYTFEIQLNEDINIIVINRLLCEEYTLSVDNMSLMFDNHKIVNNPKILYQVLCDGLEKKNDTTKITFGASKDQMLKIDEKRIFDITINVDAIYIQDSINLKLAYVDKHITPKQVIERIDYKFDEIIENIRSKMDDLVVNVDILISKESTERENSDNKIIQRICDDCDVINKKLTHLDHVHSNLKEEFNEYVSMMPIFHVDYGGQHKTINPCITNLVIRNDTILLPEGVFGRILDYDSKKFKYLKNLTNIKFDGVTHPNLDFIASDNLEMIELYNMKNLTNISHLSKFKKLKRIIIKGNNQIKDLYTLAECTGLEYLEVPIGTNTGVFSKDIKFEIKVVN